MKCLDFPNKMNNLKQTKDAFPQNDLINIIFDRLKNHICKPLSTLMSQIV